MFTQTYTNYRLTIILPSVRSYDRQTFTGSSYSYEEIDGKLSPDCSKHTLYVVWDPVSFHFGCSEPAAPYWFIKKNTRSHGFCHKCVTVKTPDCNCGVLLKKITIRVCPSCQQTPCIQSGCTKNCQLCGATYNKGYNLSEGEGQ
jgi:hypothetical protein